MAIKVMNSTPDMTLLSMKDTVETEGDKRDGNSYDPNVTHIFIFHAVYIMTFLCIC